MHPKNLSIQEFTYDLPDGRIAKYPLPEREQSKLLIYQQGTISEGTYLHLADHLPRGSFLIFNNTKVIEARLLFQKTSGSIIEIFCLEPDESYRDITSAMLQKGKVLWKCLIGGTKKWKKGPLIKIVDKGDNKFELTAVKVESSPDSYLVAFSWDDDTLSFAEVLHYAGVIPLPPYLNRDADEKDHTTYQTVYAKYDGSVAAPTAGLHFTQQLFDKLSQKGIQHEFITLHVGAGTFKPVKSEKMKDHEMHAEFIDVSFSFIQKLIENLDNTVVAIGTTSLRTIESLYWMGIKLREQLKVKNQKDTGIEDISIHQWDAYELPQNILPKEALGQLLSWMKENKSERIITKTQIIIAPGYNLKIAKGIITNFHQPQSTLLLLIASIVGNDWQKIYNYALENNFRFLSYGDGSLLWKNN